MNAEQRELFRKALLRVLEANNTRHGLGAKSLQVLTNAEGFTPKLDEVETQLRYLEGKGLVEPVNKLVSPEVMSFRITAAGMDFVAAE